jgi:hypothetical protein
LFFCAASVEPGLVQLLAVEGDEGQEPLVNPGVVDDDAHNVDEALVGDHVQQRLHPLVEVMATLSPDLEERRERSKGSKPPDHRSRMGTGRSRWSTLEPPAGLPQQEGHWDERVEQGE